MINTHIHTNKKNHFPHFLWNMKQKKTRTSNIHHINYTNKKKTDNISTCFHIFHIIYETIVQFWVKQIKFKTIK